MKPGRLSNKWLAGLLDGDCMMSSADMSKAPVPKVSFTQLDQEVVDAVQWRYKGSRSIAGARKMTYLTWSGRTVQEILFPVLPYLVVKRQLALWLLGMANCIGQPVTAKKTEMRHWLHKTIHKYTGQATYAGFSMSRIWLAGFIDADGSISVSGKVPTPTLAIAQKDVRVLYAIQKRYGGRVNTSPACSSLQWSGRSVLSILGSTLPHFKIKHEQATLAIEMCNHISPQGLRLSKQAREERHYLANSIRRLNDHREDP